MRLLVLFAVAQSVAAWTCKASLNGVNFDLSPLEGEYSVTIRHKTPPTIKHSVYAINPCKELRKSDAKTEEQCKAGTQVCRTTEIEKGDERSIIEVVAFAANTGDTQEAEVSKLSSSTGIEEDGLRVQMFGGIDGDGNDLSAVIDFICSKKESRSEPEFAIDQSGIVKFKWHTKYACADSSDDTDRPNGDSDHYPVKRGSWGFFAWFFLIVFMAIAAFLIFTLFLNYNRYGQIGLDLVPAMDSVKDVPYLFKDFASQVIETAQGNGGRSGYSAV